MKFSFEFSSIFRSYVLRCLMCLVCSYPIFGFGDVYYSAQRGPRIHGSCNHEQRQRIALVLGEVERKARDCYAEVPVPQIGVVLRKMPVFTIKCSGHHGAAASANFDRDEVTLTTASAIGNIFGDSDIRFGAEILFHEFLHLTNSNNRAWHNDSVSAGDVYTDRVYLTTSLCFPSGWYGQFMAVIRTEDKAYWTLACHRAFGEVDRELLGRHYTAPPLPRTERIRVCDAAEKIRLREVEAYRLSHQ